MSDTKTLVLPEELTAYQVVEYKDTLIESLADVKELELDASKITKIDALGIQLILSATKTAENDHILCTITSPSEIFIKNAKQLGLTEEFKLA